MPGARCSRCGGVSAGDARFCARCGASILRPIEPPRDSDIRSFRTRLETVVKSKHHSEREISRWWVIAPTVALVVLGGMISTAFFAASSDLWKEPYVEEGNSEDAAIAFFEALGDELVVALQVASVAVYAILAILSYRLVQRDNEHFEREKKLRTEIMSFVSRSRGEGSAADLPRNSERRRSPLFWFTVVIMPEILLLLALVTTAIAPLEEEQAMAQVILGWMFFVALATPFLGLQFYMFCFLNADMSGHHKRWTGLVKDTKLFLASTGYMAGTVPEPEPLPERSNGVYAIVSLLSSGLFFFYWWYVITKDGNDHIKHHEIFEREILDLLSKRPSTDRAAQAFGSGPDISPPVNA